jgi:hypothetical protein
LTKMIGFAIRDEIFKEDVTENGFDTLVLVAA